jgi:CheY-like chemotaxis protein
MSRPIDETFVRQVHRALRHLYEPVELQLSPLAAALPIPPGGRGDVPAYLRKILLEAINSLKPDPKVPADSNAWRNYQVLCYRFEEQSSQEEVADQMAISPRQVRRLEYTAIHALAEYLAGQYSLRPGEGGPAENAGLEAAPLEGHGGAGQENELDWLRKSYPREVTDARELIDSVLRTGEPLIQSAESQVQASIEPGLPPISGQSTTLRQVLLNILIAAVRACPHGLIQIQAAQAGERVRMDFLTTQRDGNGEPCEDTSEFVDLARRLIELSQGSLEMLPLAPGQVLGVRLWAPVAEQITVLAIDDNEDSLELLRRYLEGTVYRLTAARDPQRALELAVTSQARAILLDIMLPGVDGWELLGRIRAHPRLEHVPVIISTILPHEQLAASLGARAFLRKPLSREGLLEVLQKLTVDG